jgi:glycerol-3-phosphate cytidylyltransferase
LKKTKNVYVIGVFDLFHRGHLELLKKAKKLGDRLIVAINGDEMVSEYKRKPFFSEKDRLEIINSLAIVDEAFITNKFDNSDILIDQNISVIVHGNDWDRDSYLKQIRIDEHFLEENNISLAFVPYTAGISTSDLINQIKNI